jgi:hypothetical protein
MLSFNINSYDLPALILYDKGNLSIGVHRNQNVENLALLANEITFGQISQKMLLTKKNLRLRRPRSPRKERKQKRIRIRISQKIKIQKLARKKRKRKT